MARQFLMYASKVFFGYKLRNFLSLPLAEQTNEKGFYLLESWWCPTDFISYNDLSKFVLLHTMLCCEL